MLTTNRVIWKDNATLKDLSRTLNNFMSGTQVIDFVAADDKLYIGAEVPFNHRYIHVSVVNDQASVVSVDLWDGDEWVPCVDIQDGTDVGGVSLARSGILRWSTPENSSWMKEESTEDMTGSGISTLKVFGMYWARISFSGDLKNTTALKYVGHKFSEDEDLNGYYPDLNRSTVKTAFQQGKTDWMEQHVIAAEEVFRQLFNQRQAWSKSQIWEPENFTQAAVHKVAEIIYTSFGDEYEGRRDDARAKFKESMSDAIAKGVDVDEDGHYDDEERVGYTASFVRR